MKAIKVKLAEVKKEEEIIQSTDNNYSMKKWNYLRKSLKNDIEHFISNFENLYREGAWVY